MPTPSIQTGSAPLREADGLQRSKVFRDRVQVLGPAVVGDHGHDLLR